MSEPSTRTAALIEALRDEATPVDAGSFTLDASAAVAKFNEFRYRERVAYLPHVVEGLRSLGCDSIYVDRKGADIEVFASSETPLANAADRLHAIHGERFAARDTPSSVGLGRIAVAIDMALGSQGLDAVSVEYVADGRRIVAVFAEDEEPRLWEGEADDRLEGYRLRFDLGMLQLKQAEATIECLRRDAAASRREVIADGVPLHRAFELSQLESHRDDGFEIEHGFKDPPRRDPGEILYISQGMIIERERVETRDFVAAVHLERAPRDLAEASILRDDVFERARSMALEAAERRFHIGPKARPAYTWFSPQGKMVVGGILAALATVVALLVFGFDEKPAKVDSYDPSPEYVRDSAVAAGLVDGRCGPLRDVFSIADEGQVVFCYDLGEQPPPDTAYDIVWSFAGDEHRETIVSRPGVSSSTFVLAAGHEGEWTVRLVDDHDQDVVEAQSFAVKA